MSNQPQARISVLKTNSRASIVLAVLSTLVLTLGAYGGLEILHGVSFVVLCGFLLIACLYTVWFYRRMQRPVARTVFDQYVPIEREISPKYLALVESVTAEFPNQFVILEGRLGGLAWNSILFKAQQSDGVSVQVRRQLPGKYEFAIADHDVLRTRKHYPLRESSVRRTEDAVEVMFALARQGYVCWRKKNWLTGLLGYVYFQCPPVDEPYNSFVSNPHRKILTAWKPWL